MELSYSSNNIEFPIKVSSMCIVSSWWGSTIVCIFSNQKRKATGYCKDIYQNGADGLVWPNSVWSKVNKKDPLDVKLSATKFGNIVFRVLLYPIRFSEFFSDFLQCGACWYRDESSVQFFASHFHVHTQFVDIIWLFSSPSFCPILIWFTLRAWLVFFFVSNFLSALKSEWKYFLGFRVDFFNVERNVMRISLINKSMLVLSYIPGSDMNIWRYSIAGRDKLKWVGEERNIPYTKFYTAS